MSLFLDGKDFDKKIGIKVSSGIKIELEKDLEQELEHILNQKGEIIKVEASGNGVTEEWAKGIAVSRLKEMGVGLNVDYLVGLNYAIVRKSSLDPNYTYSHLQKLGEHPNITVTVSAYALRFVDTPSKS